MAISTYGELKSAVASFLHRGDIASDSEIMPTLVSLAESVIRQDIRCRAMEATATDTLAATSVDLPERFAEARRVLLNGYIQEYVTPQAWEAISQNAGDGKYTIQGQDLYFQASTGTYRLDYWQWFAAFADNGDTNWLLTNHPDIYLYATLAESAIYTRADASTYRGRYEAAKQSLIRAEQKFTGSLVPRVAQWV